MRFPVSERGAALLILRDVFERGAFANIALRETLKKCAFAEGPGAAFVTELVYTTIRNFRLLERVVDRFSSVPCRKMEPLVRAVLMLSVCQLRFLDKVPAYAAINEGVELAKAGGLGRLSGFVNGVLRSAQRNPAEPAIDGSDLGLAYSYPPELLGYLSRQLPDRARLLEFVAGSHEPPRVSVCPNTVRVSPAALRRLLEAEGVACEEAGGCLLLKETGDISRLDAFGKGLFFAMDAGALAAAGALGMEPGETLVDLAAAPGGKSFAAACAMGNRGKIISLDIHPHKIRLIKAGAARLGLAIIEARAGDALAADPSLRGAADAVLLDAPCSGLGTIRRHPEIKLRFSEAETGRLAEKQLAMLCAAAGCAKPGGRLVYSTCTVSAAENEGVARAFLKSREAAGYRLVSMSQTLPGRGGDGFFVAKFLRNLV